MYKRQAQDPHHAEGEAGNVEGRLPGAGRFVRVLETELLPPPEVAAGQGTVIGLAAGEPVA